MEVDQIAALQVANAAALMQQSASMAMVKKGAQAQMQMANVIAQQVVQQSARPCKVLKKQVF